MRASGALLAAALAAAAPAAAQEWYLPKRTSVLDAGRAELGARAQVIGNNDGLLDSTRSEFVPHLRYAPWRRLELYVEAPLAYVEREDVVQFNIVQDQVIGMGDVFVQGTFDAVSGEDWKLLLNLDGSVPTGKSPYRHRVPSGSGHGSAGLGQTALKIIDPLALFVHLGYQHTFGRRDGAGRWVAPGRTVRFRFGTAVSLNPRVQTTLHVTGDKVATSKIGGAPVAGSSGLLVRFGWGLDWKLARRWRVGTDAVFGMTKSTPDATLALGTAFSF